MSRLDDWNYFNDPRTSPAIKAPTVSLFRDGGYVEVALPTKFEVCPVCDGHGHHVNPSIDAGGLTARDFDQDPDFALDYAGGAYDVICNGCEGRRVVPEVDRERCKPDELLALDEYEREEREYQAICRAEARMGC